MELKNYNLKIKNKILLNNVNINFEPGCINHILGKNGVGKSLFAKDILLSQKDSIAIASYSNLPFDITLAELKKLLIKHFDKTKINLLSNLLNINNINPHILIKKLSDGQKQKLKILTYLLLDKKLIILDEMTNALDKTTIQEIYHFFNKYCIANKDKIIINITHDLSDLKNMKGHYFLFDNFNINRYKDVSDLINNYIKEEI